MGLQGTLDTLPVLDALEALARLRREGLLEVRGGGSRATLSMVDGALVGGEVDALVGSVADRDALVLRLVDVLATIARLDQGGFDFRRILLRDHAAIKPEAHLVGHHVGGLTGVHHGDGNHARIDRLFVAAHDGLKALHQLASHRYRV